MTNQTQAQWDAAHNIIGRIALNGIRSITLDVINQVCELYGALDKEEVKSNVDTHYRVVHGSSFNGDYINAL